MQTSQDRATQGWVLIFTILTFLVQPTVVWSVQEDLFQAIEQAKSNVVAIPASEVVRTKTLLEPAVRDLQGLLERSDEETEWGWKEYLNWEAFTEAIQSEDPDLQVLRRTYENLRRKHEGLEMRQFTGVRQTLIDYINAVAFTRQENQEELYAGLLDQLSDAIRTAKEDPSAESNSVLGRILGTLEAAGQAPEVVQQVRSEFGHPNLVARISGEFITRNTEQVIEDTRPVSEEILGSFQSGTAQTVGAVTLRTVPNSKQAELVAQLTAETNSENVGRRPVGKLGNVMIYSDSVSKVSATNRIFIDDGDLSSCGARARAQTCTDIHRVCAPKLISKLATRQVYRSKPKAEAIASQRVARRIETQFDERVGESLAQANSNFTNEVHDPLIRLDAHPDEIKFSTTTEALNMTVVQAGGYQVGADNAAPALKEDSDAAIVVHETAVNNLAESIFGGKTITDELAAEWLEVANQGELPPEFKISRDNPWSITLARYQPVTVDFGDSVLEVRIRGSRFRRGGEGVNDTIEISASYLIEKTEKGVRLTRQGEVELTYPGKEQLTVEQTAVKSFLLEKFKVVFKESAETTGVQFPGRFADKSPLELTVFNMSGGWLALAWLQADEPLAPESADADVATAALR